MLDQSQSTKSDYDQIHATKDLFANCQVSADNYISPKTLCELIKAGNFCCTCFFVGRNLVKFFYSHLRPSNPMNGNIEVASYLKIPPSLFNLKMKFNIHFSITHYCPMPIFQHFSHVFYFCHRERRRVERVDTKCWSVMSSCWKHSSSSFHRAGETGQSKFTLQTQWKILINFQFPHKLSIFS